MERVVQVPAELKPQADRAKLEMLQLLREAKLLDRKDVGLAVLAEAIRHLLAEGAEDLPTL